MIELRVLLKITKIKIIIKKTGAVIVPTINPIIASMSPSVEDPTGQPDNQKDVSAKKEDARTRILNTAVVEFAQRGYDGVSTTEIAKAAGVTQPLIHYHFKSKEALWQAAVGEVFSWLKDGFVVRVHDCAEEGATPLGNKAILVDVIRKYVEFSAVHPEFGQFILREGTQKTDRLDWMVDTWVRPTLSRFIKAHRRGIEDGWLKDIPFAQLVSIVTASVSQFFSFSPMFHSLYGVDVYHEDQVAIHSDIVVDIITNALVIDTSGTIKEIREEEMA